MGCWTRGRDVTTDSGLVYGKYRWPRIDAWTELHLRGAVEARTAVLCGLGGLRSNDAPAATSTSCTRMLASAPSLKKRNPGCVEKWLIVGLG